MVTRPSRAFAAAALLMLAVGCGEPRSHTGFEGTWAREHPLLESTLQIAERDGQWYVMWLLESEGGGSTREVRCDWGVPCEEFVDGEKTSEYTFSATLDEDTGHLLVACEIEVSKPNELRSSYLDELVLDEDGLGLWSYTREKDGREYELGRGPKRHLVKTSDRVRPLTP